MGWNPNCDKCKCKPCCCKRPRPCHEEKPCCPPAKMQAIPVITTDTEPDFDPNNTCKKYIYTFVIDPKNKITYFYDAFGICSIISNDGNVEKTLLELIATKQALIAEYNTTTMYNPGDLAIEGNRILMAKTNTTGTFNPEDWQTLDGSEANPAQYTFVAVLPEVADADPKKTYVLPDGKVYFFQGGEYIEGTTTIKKDLSWKEYTGIANSTLIELSRIMTANYASATITDNTGLVVYQSSVDLLINDEPISLILTANITSTGESTYNIDGQYLVTSGDASVLNNVILQAAAKYNDNYGFVLRVNDSTVENIKVRLNSSTLSKGTVESNLPTLSDVSSPRTSRGIVESNFYDQSIELQGAM